MGLDLQPLSPVEVAKLLEAALPGGMVTARLARWVAERSAGNPLYCRELVLAALAAGSIGRDGGLWQQAGPPVLSTRLTELLHERLGVLADAEREALELVVLAEPVELDLLERLAGPRLLATLEQRRLIAVDGTAPLRVRLGHPLYGDVIRQDLGEVRRRQLGQVLADALEERGDADPRSLLRVAIWRLDSGTAQPGLLTRAAYAASICLTRRWRCDWVLRRCGSEAGRERAWRWPGPRHAATISPPPMRSWRRGRAAPGRRRRPRSTSPSGCRCCAGG